MRIGIDTHLLSYQVTGIPRYIMELTKELIKKDGTFFLYNFHSIINGDWQMPNVKVRTSGFNGRISNMLWSQTCVPYWVKGIN
jgi:hypothetical protein